VPYVKCSGKGTTPPPVWKVLLAKPDRVSKKGAQPPINGLPLTSYSNLISPRMAFLFSLVVLLPVRLQLPASSAIQSISLLPTHLNHGDYQ